MNLPASIPLPPPPPPPLSPPPSAPPLPTPPTTEPARRYGGAEAPDDNDNTRTTPKASFNTNGPVDTSTAVAMTAAAAVPSSRSSPAVGAILTNLHHPIKPVAVSSPLDLALEYTRSPPPMPSPVVLPRSAIPERSMSERSPSPHTRSPVPGAMADAIGGGRGPNIIRRLSRGASNKIRRRPSHQHSLRMRDQSAGPVIMRRRSDSNAASDFYPEMSDLELEPGHDDVLSLPPPPPPEDGPRGAGLGISVGRRSDDSNSFEGGIAPSISAVLQSGTLVHKYTRRKSKLIHLHLDPNTARVCWHPTNPTKSFFIDDVREVRVGSESRNLRDDIQVPEAHEWRFVSVLYDVPERSKGRSYKTMHLLMPDDGFILGYWKDALSTVARERTEVMNALSPSPEKSEKSMAMAWKLRKGASPDELFALEDARWLCRRLEINCSDNAVRTHFTRSDTARSGLLSYAQYQDFINSFKERKDIQNLYRNMKCGTDLDMDLDSFLDFLKVEQNADPVKDHAHWKGVFERFARPMPPDRIGGGGGGGSGVGQQQQQQRTLNMQGFQNFLTSSYNSPLVPVKGEVSFDRPLNEYFISSSHNTYLLGRQVAGASSVEGYIGALIKGCRCVEIDCWDGDDGRPMVTHGRTMTTKIPFEDCVSVVAKYAFHSSHLPLVVSLEVHCSADQQRAMVELMTRHFDGMMVTEPVVTNALSLPSPDELKKRILIKVKAAEEAVADPSSSSQQQQPPAEPTGASAGGRSRSRAHSLGSAFNSITRSPSVDKYHNTPAMSMSLASTPITTSSPSETNAGFMSTPQGSCASGPTNTPSSSADDSDEPLAAKKQYQYQYQYQHHQQHQQQRSKQPKTSKIIPELGKLGVYAQGISYSVHGFNNTPGSRTVNHIFSLNEHLFDKLCTKTHDTKTMLEKHNLHHLMRVYPAAKRYDSSNFNPLRSWRRGVQMAALNWQTYDVHQQVNEAMFAAGSDRLGYVLKPDELRHAKHLPIADTLPDAPERKAKKGKKVVRFSVEVISAQRLPRPRHHNQEYGMNPYIEFEMFSAEDKARGESGVAGSGADASTRNNNYYYNGNNNNNSSSNNNGGGGSGIASPLRKRTKLVEGNGFDPIYNESITMTVETKYPSLIFVRWTVWNAPEARKSSSNNTLLATFTAKLDSLQQGYRHLPLFNPHGEQYRDAKLFVRIKKEAPVPLYPPPPDRHDHHLAYGLGSQDYPHPSSPSSSFPSSSTFSAARPSAEQPSTVRGWPRRMFSRNSSQRGGGRLKPESHHLSPQQQAPSHPPLVLLHHQLHQSAAGVVEEPLTLSLPISRTESWEREVGK